MATNTQFSVAVHIMAGLAYRCGQDTTSGLIAASVNTSPSFVRRILSRLAKAGLIETATGKAGACWLATEPERISLLDIYRAVEAPRAFSIHRHPVLKQCPVSCKIKAVLENTLEKTQAAMEKSLAGVTLARIRSEIQA